MSGSDARFVELYRRHYRHVYAYCRRRTTSEHVEDAVADTFATVWRKIAVVPVGSDALPWIYAVAHRVLGHQWRGASRRSNLRLRLDAFGVATPSPPEEVVLVDQESRRIVEALSRLKATDQEVLRLHVWEELGHQEIAEVLGISLSAVQKRFSRAKNHLADEFNRAETTHISSPAAQKRGAW